MNKNTAKYRRWHRDAKATAGAGLACALLVGLATYGVGWVSAGEAKVLLEAMLPTSRFLCSAVTTAAATILALMLTLLSMVIQMEKTFDRVFYLRIQQIAFYVMLCFISAALFLSLHCLPITKSDEVPSWWYSATYYSILTSSALLTGGIVATVAMLYATIRDLIGIVCPDDESAADEEQATQ